jgi:hypothetical protein
MNHLNSRLLMSLACVLAVAANNPSAQMSMRQSMPMVPQADISSRTIEVASTPRSTTLQPNPRFEQIDRRATTDRRTVDHMIAPEPIKQEVREQIGDAATVDKYIADMDRRKP